MKTCRTNLAIWLQGATLSLLLMLPGMPEATAEPRYDVVIQRAWIPMPDGIRLAADLYMPTGIEPDSRFPILLEYLPYRGTEARGHRCGLFAYFVSRGYVVARVDIRGTGISEGKLVEYEYSEQEQADGEVVIDWLSRQSWTNGNVGMLGISWGGFNSIHMAMRHPPALKAIIAVDATDDTYQDDVHFIDGIMHADSYELQMDVANAIPGAPDYVIDEQYFADRFDTLPWFLHYKRQQRDGPFWDRTSLNTRYDSIRIPTFVIGGWYDGYRDSVPRMLENMSAPVKAMVGPWLHTWPHWGFPGESIEWREVAVRWFDHWLKGVDTGVMDEPAFAVYVRNWHPPGLDVKEIPGFWRYEDGWPLERAETKTLYLDADHRLTEKTASAGSHQLRYQPDVGLEAGGSAMWWGNLQEDQRPVDAYSLVYDTAPLEEKLEILGFPTLEFKASTDAPRANWFARLSDVAPDGRTTLVAGAGLNGAHRNSAEEPEALLAGKVYPLNIEMHFTSWAFPRDHKIRLAVNNAQWPMFWPTPYPMTTTLELGGKNASRLLLPVVPDAPRPKPSYPRVTGDDPTMHGFGEDEDDTESGYAELAEVTRDIRNGVKRVIATNSARSMYPWGTSSSTESIIHEVDIATPAQTRVSSDIIKTIHQEGRNLKWTGIMEFSSDAENFYYEYTRRLHENSELIREKHWQETIPRDYN